MHVTCVPPAPKLVGQRTDSATSAPSQRPTTFEPAIAVQGGHHDRQQKIAIGAWESEGGSVAASN